MKTIAELKRRRQSLDAEIARREAEHESYMEAKRAAEKILAPHYARHGYTTTERREHDLRLHQAEALKTIPVRTPRVECTLDPSVFIGGPFHGRTLSVAVTGRQFVNLNGHRYKRLPRKWDNKFLFISCEDLV